MSLPRLAFRLRKMRTERGITQEQLSKHTGIPIASISHMESGRIPTADQAYRLAKFYDCEMEDFWTPPKVTGIQQ